MHKFASTLFCNSLYLQFDSFAYARSVQLCKKRSKKEEADQILAILFFCQIYFWQTEPLWLMVIGQKTASAILQGSRYNWRTCRAHGRTKILNLIFAPINLQLKSIISELQLFQFFKIKHHKYHLISFYLHQLIC